MCSGADPSASRNSCEARGSPCVFGFGMARGGEGMGLASGYIHLETLSGEEIRICQAI